MKFAKLPKNPLDKLSASHSFSPEVRESYCLWHILPKEANGNAFVLLVAARGHCCGKPQKTCSRNNSIKKQMYFIGNSTKCAHLVLNYSSCKVLQSHLGPA